MSNRHPGGRTCQLQALMLLLFFPIALPLLAARSVWLRRRGRVASR